MVHVVNSSPINLHVILEYLTLQGTNISHLGKRKSIFNSALVGDMLVLGSVDIAAPVWGPVSIFSGREESEPFFLQESHN